MRSLALIAALLAPLLASGQSVVPAEPAAQAAHGQRPLAAELKELAGLAATLDHELPSFACQEAVTSQDRHRGKVKRTTRFVANLRSVRLASGRLDESFSVTAVDGEPFTSGHFYSPAMVSGGFDSALRYFATERQACYQYKLSPGRIDFVGLRSPAAPKQCEGAGEVGFALLDAAGRPTHLERRVTEAAARAHRLATFAAIDLRPVELNGRSYLLSQHAYSEVWKPRGLTGTFDATYSHCALFTATITMHSVGDGDASPSGNSPEPRTPAAAPKGPSR